MKISIINRIKALGGVIGEAKDNSLHSYIEAIEFTTVLYPKPITTVWQTDKETEPIYGLNGFIEEHQALFHSNNAAFNEQLLFTYYCLTKEPRGQVFF